MTNPAQSYRHVHKYVYNNNNPKLIKIKETKIKACYLGNKEIKKEKIEAKISSKRERERESFLNHLRKLHELRKKIYGSCFLIAEVQ